MGHSGARLLSLVSPSGEQFVLKDGPSDAIREEFLHMQSLKETGVCIQPLAAGHGVILLPALKPMRGSHSLTMIYRLLSKNVWTQQAPLYNTRWPTEFAERFGGPPIPSLSNDRSVLVHGDPTAANLLFDGQQYMLCDPKRPGRGIPPFRAVDLGKMMQSALGWEVLLDSTWPDMDLPAEEMVADGLTEHDLLGMVFWCIVHLIRIQQREQPGSDVDIWASTRIGMLGKLVGG